MKPDGATSTTSADAAVADAASRTVHSVRLRMDDSPRNQNVLAHEAEIGARNCPMVGAHARQVRCRQPEPLCKRGRVLVHGGGRQPPALSRPVVRTG